MNKKILSIAASILLALPLTVAAAPSQTVTGNATDKDGNPIGGITIEEVAEKHENDVAELANADFPNGWRVAQVFEIKADDVAKTTVKDGVANIHLTVAVAGDFKLYHITGGKAIRVAYNAVGNQISFTVDVKDLSPFVLVQSAKDGTPGYQKPTPTPTTKPNPNTSDSTQSVLWGSIAMISLACAAGVVVARKRNA